MVLKRLLALWPRQLGIRCRKRQQTTLALALFLCAVWAVLNFPDADRGLLNSGSAELLWGVKGTHPGGPCVLPILDPSHRAMKQFFHEVTSITCWLLENWVYVERGNFRISEKARQVRGDISCRYIPFSFKDDYNVSMGTPQEPMKDGTAIVSDFFKVECTSESGGRYSNYHASVPVSSSLLNRHKDSPLASDSLGLDVLILAFDSVSRMTWLRTMPKTRHYFVRSLGALELSGYNVVGDGPTAAFLPILTGKTEQELPEARWGFEGARPLDDHPWIWKEYERQGYVTMWGEDMPDEADFQRRMLGFAHQPVDHYMRPFYVALREATPQMNRSCLGSQASLQVFLNWYKDAFLMYKNVRKFAVGFYRELRYDHNLLQNADMYTYEFLEYLVHKRLLTNTLVILMSDHGTRYSHLKVTAQGKLEERMPYLAFRFPPWFQRKYPEAMRNFRSNQVRLTTPFDVHETLRDILHFSGARNGSLSSRGISLFQRIPKERTCAHAGVGALWCACLEWEAVDPNNTVVQEVALSAVEIFNSWTETVRDRCSRLTLGEVSRAVVYAPNTDLLKFRQRADHHAQEADLTDDMFLDEILCHLTLVTRPNGGQYEMTLRYNLISKDAHARPQDVSRINKHGSEPDCVGKRLARLKPYCNCAPAQSHRRSASREERASESTAGKRKRP